MCHGMQYQIDDNHDSEIPRRDNETPEGNVEHMFTRKVIQSKFERINSKKSDLKS